MDTWAASIISLIFKMILKTQAFKSFTGSWPKFFIPLIFNLIIYYATIKLLLQLPMHHARHCSNILDSWFIKTNKIIYSHNCINLRSYFTKHDALVSVQAIKTIYEDAVCPAFPIKHIKDTNLLWITQKLRHKRFETHTLFSHLTSLLSKKQSIVWFPALYLWQIVAKEATFLLCPCSSQHQPGSGSCNSSMQPPPVPFSYMHSQQTPQQIYLWRHFVSLILRIHRNICIIHHSLLQETFFILHLK